MAERKFDLGDYVEVKDRLGILYELYPQARLVTDEVTILTAPDDKQRVMVKALCYRTPDDPHPAVGYSWMELPGTTSYTKGSELENTETSAWGRAIAALGILVDKSIASAQEVRNKSEPTAHDEPIETNGIQGFIGTVAKGKPPVDMEIRATPDGLAWGFALKDGNRKFQVMAYDAYAELLSMSGIDEGDRVTVKGPIEDVPWEKKLPGGEFKTLTFRRIRLEWLKPPSGDPIVPPPEHAEAPSVPLFTDAEEAALDAALDDGQ